MYQIYIPAGTVTCDKTGTRRVEGMGLLNIVLDHLHDLVIWHLQDPHQAATHRRCNHQSVYSIFNTDLINRFRTAAIVI
jgi:hypothetical protein